MRPRLLFLTALAGFFYGCMDFKEPPPPAIPDPYSNSTPDGGSCGSTPGAFCKPGSVCKGGTCVAGATACIGVGGLCSSSGDCCGILQCNKGTCDGGGCRAIGVACTGSADCCGSATCRDSICKP